MPEITDFKKEYDLDGKRIFPNAYLASMSGVTDAAFRRLCKRLSGDRTSLLVSEFVSVEGMQGKIDPKKQAQLRFYEEEHPFVIQIFGHTPKHMAMAAKRAQELGADYLEINAGCPAPKVVDRGSGAGLLKDLPNLRDILNAVKDTIDIPMLVKTRIGWCENSVNVLETLRLVEECGGAQFTLHGRHRMQGYKGTADWDIISQVAKEAKIPVLGNGDVRSPQEARDRIIETGVDGVVIGRAAMHNPWLFGQIADLWEGKDIRFPNMDEQVEMFEVYRELLEAEGRVEKSVIGRIKQMTARFCNSIIGGEDLRELILRSEDITDFFNKLHAYYKQLRIDGREIQYRPDLVRNLNGTKKKEVEEGCDFQS